MWPQRVGSSWRVVSGKTGKLWPQTYDSKAKAEDALQAYFANMNEATEEEIERQKEYNAELEKTDSLVSQISTKSQLRETIKSYIKEKLTKKSKVGDFVDDFTKSDAKQFKGKSEKKKKEMAVAAYLAKQNKK